MIDICCCLVASVLPRIRDTLRSEKVVIAGGSVLKALTGGENVRTGKLWGKTGDIDLFVYGMENEEASQLVRRIFLAIAVDNEAWVIVRTRGVINIHNGETKIQIVLRIYDSPAEILLGFDVDCSCCCFDGRLDSRPCLIVAFVVIVTGNH